MWTKINNGANDNLCKAEDTLSGVKVISIYRWLVTVPGVGATKKSMLIFP